MRAVYERHRPVFARGGGKCGKIRSRSRHVGCRRYRAEIRVLQGVVQVRGQDAPALVRRDHHEFYLSPLFKFEERAQHGIVFICRRHHAHPRPKKAEYAEVESLGAVLGEREGIFPVLRAHGGEQKTPAILYLHRGVQRVAVSAPATVGGVGEVVHQSVCDALGLETRCCGIVKIYHDFLLPMICALPSA